MTEDFDSLASIPLQDLARRMATPGEGTDRKAWFLAEFTRRQTKAQIDAASMAKWSILVASVAIAAAAAVEIWATLSTAC